MSVAVATAHNQYVFRRNFSSRKWESLSGSGKMCRIQVVKKGGADYTLRIFPEEGEVCPLLEPDVITVITLLLR